MHRRKLELLRNKKKIVKFRVWRAFFDATRAGAQPGPSRRMRMNTLRRSVGGLFRSAHSWTGAPTTSSSRSAVRRVDSLRSVGEVRERAALLESASGTAAPLPEICVIGATNVGKSSLLNHVLGYQNRARASSVPGRTSAVDVFDVDERVALVDLPGYSGVATDGRVERQWNEEWGELVDTYLTTMASSASSPLRAALLLVDSRAAFARRERDSWDVRVAARLVELGIPTLLILTKDDRLVAADRQAQGGSGRAIDVRASIGVRKLQRAVRSARRPGLHGTHEQRPSISLARALKKRTVTRDELAGELRASLRWPAALPHIHYTTEQRRCRSHVRRFLRSFVEAPDRAACAVLLRNAWSTSSAWRTSFADAGGEAGDGDGDGVAAGGGGVAVE